MLLALCHICLGLNVVGIQQVIINGHREPRPLPADTGSLGEDGKTLWVVL